MIFSSQWRKFSIEISNPGLFCVSQWDPSVWFIIYKVLVTILMLSITSAHIAINLDRLGWKWIIFLTNQGLILIILHNILHLFLVLRNRFSNEPPTTNFIFKETDQLDMLIETISINIALFVTVLYWTVVHAYVIQYRLLQDELDWIFNVFNHSFNTLLSLLDLILSARPVTMYHAYLPMSYGLLYSLFSLVYWLLGGEGICGAVLCCEETVCPTKCAPVIYPMLDWANNPTLALITTAGGCVVVLVFTSVYYGIYRVRGLCYRKIYIRDDSVQNSGTTI